MSKIAIKSIGTKLTVVIDDKPIEGVVGVDFTTHAGKSIVVVSVKGEHVAIAADNADVTQENEPPTPEQMGALLNTAGVEFAVVQPETREAY